MRFLAAPSLFSRLTLQISPGLCNQQCLVCRVHSPWNTLGKPTAQLNWQQIESQIRNAHAQGVRELIPGSMGEPLLHPEFPNIVDLCNQLRWNINILSNGSFPQGIEYWHGILKNSQIKMQFGITQSWAELSQQGFQSKVAHWQSLHCGATTFQIAVSTRTKGDLAKWLRFAKQCGIRRIKLNALVMHFKQLQTWQIVDSPAWILRLKRLNALANTLEMELSGSATRLSLPYPRLCTFRDQEIWINEFNQREPCPLTGRREMAVCPKNCHYI